ncbi:histidine phosphatase superfamily [Ochromonadaceae sp. CCMP2298]|nr:histidine phosphatase superfamily [Ochromonadaceae sp. CCMP2298]
MAGIRSLTAGIGLATMLSFNKSHCLGTESGSAGNKQYTAVRVKDAKTKSKVVHFVRHAQGHHNVAGKTDPLFGYLREDLEDAVLTDFGISQCVQLAAAGKADVKGAKLLVVSPLHRTMQTATLSFPHLVGKIPFIAYENLREQTGLHPCDRRKPLSVHRLNFQHVDFAHVADETDPLYYKYTLREPKDHVAARARLFMQWLGERPEEEIIVVSHKGYLLHLFGIIDTGGKNDEFENCEMRSFVVNFA